MQGNARPSLKGGLVFLTEDESPPVKGTLKVDYIVLRRVNIRKDYVYVEFVDGDVRDEKEWFEGPVPEYMTIGALFGMRDEMNRSVRREVYGRRKLQDKVNHDVSTGKECECTESSKSSDGDERGARNAVELVLIKGGSSEDADKCKVDGSSCAGSQSSAGTREKLSCAVSAKRTKTCPDAEYRTLRVIDDERTKTCADVHKSKVGGVDPPKQKARKIGTRSTTKKGVEWGELAG
jgi:hypothetical protein